MSAHPDWASLEARAEAAEESAGQAPALLVTLWRPGLPEDEWLRVTNRPARRTIVDGELVYTLISRGRQWMYLPLSYKRPVAGAPAQLRLDMIDNSTLSMLRSVQPRTRCRFEVVQLAAPDVVVHTTEGLYVTAAPWDGSSITLTLSGAVLNREPWPARRFIPSHFPGMFR